MLGQMAGFYRIKGANNGGKINHGWLSRDHG